MILIGDRFRVLCVHARRNALLGRELEPREHQEGDSQDDWVREGSRDRKKWGRIIPPPFFVLNISDLIAYSLLHASCLIRRCQPALNFPESMTLIPLQPLRNHDVHRRRHQLRAGWAGRCGAQPDAGGSALPGTEHLGQQIEAGRHPRTPWVATRLVWSPWFCPHSGDE